MESENILTIEVFNEENLVEIRKSCRFICDKLGFSTTDQVRITTSVSEIARNIYEYANRGTISFNYIEKNNKCGIEIISVDEGPGIKDLNKILDGKYISRTGLGVGIKGARSLMNEFYIDTELGKGTTVRLIKYTSLINKLSTEAFNKLKAEIKTDKITFKDALVSELENQNKDLLSVLEELNQSNSKLEVVNNELIETNSGIVVLNNEMAQKNIELDNLNKNLKNAMNQLNEKNSELKSFNYTVSHDLKAPLRGITGYAQELFRKHIENLSERGVFCVNQIHVASKQLDALIEDLLSYSKLETETVQVQDVSIELLLENIIRQRQKIIEENEINLKLNVTGIIIKTWENGLIHIISNLVDNAFKYSSKTHNPEITIFAEIRGTELFFKVTDNGIGFDMKYHNRMFELFHRLVRNEDFEGTGAGLAIVKKNYCKTEW
ncbi:MAG: hypothetical protein H8E34_11695 [Bacteroidetes bacterium]|nr:hypothetical protein [Bacteroidota bacterium]MBL6944376.1 hypothetical protein [Bacteroidales bacterium]